MRADEAHNLRALFSGPNVSHGGLFCLECHDCPRIFKLVKIIYQ